MRKSHSANDSHSNELKCRKPRSSLAFCTAIAKVGGSQTVYNSKNVSCHLWYVWL